jgi:hypothetical protein
LEEVSLEKLYQWSKEVVKKYQLEVMVLDKQAQKKAGLNTWTNWVINRYLFYGLFGYLLFSIINRLWIPISLI